MVVPESGYLGSLICLVNRTIIGSPLDSEECPFCHKFLGAELLSREEADTREVLKEKDLFLKTGLTVEAGERIAEHPDSFVTYKFAYRCRECGKEWARFQIRKAEISREYVEDEEEKTDHESDEESEAERGEEYTVEEG